MIILGIETATDRAGVALGGDQGVVASFSVNRGRRHVESLVPAVATCCQHAGVQLSEVTCVAVDVGPGLFTGLRVGVTTAKALASALGAPMIGMCSLDVLAFPLRHTPTLVAAVVDAKRGEVFSGLYRHVPAGTVSVRGPMVGLPEELAAELVRRHEPVLAVGDGARRHALVLSQVHLLELDPVGFTHPTAESLVELAHPLAVAEQFVAPCDVLPLYLRAADATANFQTLRRGA